MRPLDPRQVHGLRPPAQVYSPEIAHEMLKPIVALLYERRYTLGLLSMTVQSLVFVISLSVRSMATGCVHYLLGIEGSGHCVAGVVEGVVSFCIVFAVVLVCLRTFSLGRMLHTTLSSTI